MANVTVVGTLLTTGMDEIPLRNDSQAEGTEFSLTTDTNITTVAQDVGSYKPGATVTHGYIASANSISFAFVLRQGVVIALIPVAAPGVQGQLLPLSNPVTLVPGDDVRVLSLTATARNAALCVLTNRGIARIFVGTPSGAGTTDLLDTQTSNSIGDTLQNQSVVQAYFTSVDGSKIVSGGGAWIRNPSGQIAGAIPATNPQKVPAAPSMVNIPISLNFTATVVTNA